VNQDGKLDVATVNFGSSTVSVFRNRTGERVQICTVPSVRGSTLAAAKKEIAQAHCRVGQISSEPYRAPAGRVVVESPPAGTRMRSGGRVDLVVSRKLRP
jgi:beta-lactam-binding protein with PASTA domain